MNKNLYVCFDIGGTAIKYGLIDENGVFIEKNTIATEARLGAKHIVQTLKTIIHGYVQQTSIKGIAISTAGIVDYKQGEVVFAYPENFPGYSGTKWKTILEAEFNLPCAVENDVNCAALGEMWLGAGKDKNSLFAITVGTGIGGCAVINQKVIHGACNSAGEIASLRLPNGSLEKIASVTKLVDDVAKAKGLKPSNLDGKKIFSWAKDADIVAKQAINNLVNNLADGIANIVAILNPQVIVLGGGIMAQQAYLKPLIEEALQVRLLPDVYTHTKIAFAKLANDAGMLGALYNLLHNE